MNNVYYSPEKFGLKVFGEADREMGYEYDTFVVWRQSDGGFRWAADTGCSCPTPFEDYSLDNLPLGTARDALTDLDAWVAEYDFSQSERAEAARGLREKLQEAVA